jgi:sterol desaturase/sphingolipid hydroxylase (fatty acid hydroxylase superfamily)
MFLGVEVTPYFKEFAMIAVLFVVLEDTFPAIRRPRSLRTFLTDIGYWVAKPWVTLASIAAVGLVGAGLILLLFGSPEGSGIERFFNRDTPVRHQPLWLQTIEVAVCLDFCGYWAHRLSHRIGALWRFHSVHHSAQTVTWMTTERIHPIDGLWVKLFYGVPPILLGFDMSGFFLGATFLTFYAVLTHANVPWGFGPLKYVVVTPLSHRWHHTSQEEGLDRNFAVGFVWLDMLFGTFYLPRDRQPEQFGVRGEYVPESFVGQLAWPFRSKQVRAVE